ncbi:MAG: RNA polymerase sigma-70 factor [Bacteroidota bacterium]
MLVTASTTDLELIAAIKGNDQKAYRALFDRYYKYLLVTAYAYVKDENTIRDLTQDVFFEIWKKRNSLNISNVKAYLRRSVINKALNYIKAQRMNFEDSDEPFDQPEHAKVQENLEAEELQKVINEAVENLPERCRVVFALRRFEELSLKEIAAKLDISPKTVENQLTKAMKILRKAVAPYISNGLFFYLIYFYFS